MDPVASESVESFRTRVIEFLDVSESDGIACSSFGAIMPPAVFEQACAWQRHCHRHGFAGIDWPSEFGGCGLGPEHARVWSEECARRGVAPYMNFQGYVLAGGAIRRFGTDDQKSRFLEATLAAETVWCQLFSEPGAGSDLVSLSARAEPTDNGWVVSGQKVWSSTAQLAQRAILLARTHSGEAGHRGISFFLFDMTAPGVEVRPIKQMTGDEEFSEVFLDEAPIASEDLLGPLHGGWTVATSVLADERAGVGAAGIGLERRIDSLLASSNVRSELRDRLLTCAVGGGALGRLVGRTGGDPMLGPLTKLALTEIESELSRLGVDLVGAESMVTSKTVEAFLYAPGMRVAGGTSEIQRNLIGERLLGLPREPRPPAARS